MSWIGRAAFKYWMTATKQARFYEIDLLRFLAACCVVLFHYGFAGYAAAKTKMPCPSLAPVAKYGYLGVDLFFMISGFVILMTASKGSARAFVISRMVRLFPAFWVCCTLTFLTSLLIGGTHYAVTWRQYAVNMTMLNEFVGVASIDGVYWSLFIELRFYAMVLAVLLFGQIERVKLFLGGWLLLSAAAEWWPVKHSGVFAPDYAAYFVSGAMFYVVWKEGWSLYKALVLLGAYLLALIVGVRKAAEVASYYHGTISAVVVALTISVFYIVLLAIVVSRRRDFGSPKWLWLGALTYPLYLIHQHIGFILFDRLYPRFSSSMIVAGTIAIMLVSAYFINRQLEIPWAKRLKGLLERVIPGPPAMTGRRNTSQAVPL